MKHKLIYTKLSLIFIAVIALNSCKTPLPERKVDILMPIIKTTIGPNNITEFTSKLNRANEVFTVSDPRFNPGLSSAFINDNFFGNNIVIYSNSTFSNDFEYMALDSAFVKVTLKNDYPVAVKAGTIVNFISVGNSANPWFPVDKLLFSYTLLNDLPANTTFTFEKTLLKASETAYIAISNKIKVVLDNFSTRGVGSTPINILPTSNLKLDFNVTKVKVHEVWANKKKFTIKDTVNFNFDPEGAIDKDNITGKMTFYFKNDMPADFKFQITTLDASNNVLSTVFNPEISQRGTKLGADGKQVEISSIPPIYTNRNDNTVNSEQTIEVTGVAFDHLMKAKKLIISAEADCETNTSIVPGQNPIRFSKYSVFNLQGIVDINALVDKK